MGDSCVGDIGPILDSATSSSVETTETGGAVEPAVGWGATI